MRAIFILGSKSRWFHLIFSLSLRIYIYKFLTVPKYPVFYLCQQLVPFRHKRVHLLTEAHLPRDRGQTILCITFESLCDTLVRVNEAP